MAKASRKQYISKGQRKSAPLKRKHERAVTGNDNNAMREAFLSAPFADAVRYSRMGAAIIRAVQQEPKRTIEQVRGWSAKLSFRTYQQLKAQEIVA